MGLLDGDIASIVSDALVGAGMSKPATLIKSTPGIRMPGAVSAGTNPTTQSFAAQGLEASLTRLAITGTLLAGVDAAIRLFGASIAGGQIPAPTDKIVMGGKTYTIIDKGVSTDPAKATYLCQCRA